MLTIAEIKEKTTPTLREYGIARAGVFGSIARGEARPDSDVDILVKLGDNPISLWDLVALKNKLAGALKRSVDVLSDRAILPYFREYIYRDLKIFYE